jgi:hypothetical protein
MDCTAIFKDPIIFEIVSPGFIRLYDTTVYWDLLRSRCISLVDANYVMGKVGIVEPG